jgi:hypothetical protein
VQKATAALRQTLAERRARLAQLEAAFEALARSEADTDASSQQEADLLTQAAPHASEDESSCAATNDRTVGSADGGPRGPSQAAIAERAEARAALAEAQMLLVATLSRVATQTLAAIQHDR